MATSFPLPANYDRMLIKSDLQDEDNWALGYCHMDDINEWMYRTNSGFNTLTPGAWMIFEGQFQFVPAPNDGARIQFPYITKNYARGENAQTKPAFNNDNDTFLIDNRLLTLGLVWKWREQKRLDATGDQANFEKRFNELAGRDKGSRIIKTGKARFPGNLSNAYPFALGS